MDPTKSLIPSEIIEQSILFIRAQKVMLDMVLAKLYGVETSALNRAVQRNIDRFPQDFMFQLTQEEADSLKCHFGISKGKGGRRYLPYVFTEHGIAMVSGILHSKRAIQVNVEIMRIFVRMRRILDTNKILAKRMDELEKKYTQHDHQFKMVFDAIRQLMEPPVAKKRKIGFVNE